MNHFTSSFCRTLSGFAAVAVLIVAVSSPAAAERVCPAAGTAAVNLQVWTLSVPDPGKSHTQTVQTNDPSVLVNGGGRGQLTDPDGEKFQHQFDISALLKKDGSAQGVTNFVFSGLFSQKWGAVPGVDVMHLRGDFTSGSVAQDGTVTLTGPFIETDYSRDSGIVYQEDSRQSGQTPLKIVIAGPPSSRKFTLSWCSFIPPAGMGSFSIEVGSGSLRVHYIRD